MISTETGNRRLLELAKVLDRVPKAHPIDTNKIHGYDQSSVTHPCGSPACAWGHWLYGNIKRYKRLLKADGCATEDLREAVSSWRTPETEEFYVSYYNGGPREFSLSPYEVDELFSVSGCGRANTGKEAANYIRAFVANRRRVAREYRKAI